MRDERNEERKSGLNGVLAERELRRRPGVAISASRAALDRLHRSVAQPGSAPRSGRGGRRFESSHSDHFPNHD